MRRLDPNWFRKTIQGWRPELVWEQVDLARAETLLAEIASHNGGVVIEDCKISGADRAAYAVLRAEDAVQRQMNRYASIREPHQSRMHFSIEDNEGAADLPAFLALKKLQHKYELNRATLADLDSLPGIGKVTGQRIIDRREALGPFRSLDELRDVKGISKADFEKFEGMIYLDPHREHPVLHFGPLDRFCSSPELPSYASLMEAGVSMNDEDGPSQLIQQRILRTLEEVRREVALNEFGTLSRVPYTLASRALEELEIRKNGDTVEAIQGRFRGRLLFDRQYQAFLEVLLGKCVRSLDIVMFYFRFEDKKNYVTDSLVDRIVHAHKQGVAVRIILDVDEEGDVYHSGDINAEVHAYLKKHGVPVVLDRPSEVTHSKLLIVDGRYVVVGSHNWTAGSFYVYDDVSVFLDSEELAANYTRDFEHRWKDYNN